MGTAKQFDWEGFESFAFSLGFSEIGSADAHVSLKREGMVLDEWIGKRFHGSMKYMEETKEVRKDISKFLPGTKSVLVLALPYFQSQGWSEGEGIVARYALGKDYHKVIKKLLQKIIEYLVRNSFHQASLEDFRISVDAHPVLERAWAVKAGIGFIGKNSCLITRSAGSWVLLGLIASKIEIPVKPRSDEETKFLSLGCGSCLRCLDACPTSAFSRAGMVDSRKCISYLTIENKGEIPEEFKKSIGRRIFGCDACQEVCPYNKPREKEWKNNLTSAKKRQSYTLAEILEIKSDGGFLDTYAGTPMMRIKRNGLQRNARIAVFNSFHS